MISITTFKNSIHFRHGGYQYIIKIIRIIYFIYIDPSYIINRNLSGSCTSVVVSRPCVMPI